MRIFITGGTGFIGRRVVKELRKRVHKVKLLSFNLRNLKVVEKELRRFKPDVVIHLAWEGLPDISSAQCRKNLKMGTAFVKLLGILRVPKVIAMGSAWEYENLRGTHRAIILAKRGLQRAGRLHIGKRGVFVWAVPFFVYGAGKPGRSLLPSLIAQARRGETPIPKDLNAWHDFIYIDDVVRAIVLLTEKKVKSGTYDIGSGRLARTGDIAYAVARQFKLPWSRFSPVKKTGLRANIKALHGLGWRPRTSIAQGVAAMTRQLYGKRI